MARILFVQTVAFEQLGVMSVAAVARPRGHVMKLAFGRDAHILRAARAFRPDIVGFSVVTGLQTRWIRMARALKACLDPPPLTVFGGPHPTFFPHVAEKDAVDVACRGEAEGAFVDLLDAFETGERRFTGIPNLVVQNGDGLSETPMRPLVDVDDLPFPDREISFEHRFLRNDPCVRLAAGRGCPYSCSFCYAARLREICRGLGPLHRQRSVDNLLDEIGQIHARWGPRTLYFVDDTFGLDRTWLFAFLEAYARRYRFPFFCQVRADQMTADMARALKDAGCYRTSFGLESGVERLRNEILNKKLKDETIREAAAHLHAAGLPFETTNMMGFPGERLPDAMKTLELNIEIGADVAWTGLYQPYPGTDLGERTLREGLIDRFPDNEKIAHSHTASLLRQDDIEVISRLHKFAYVAVRFPAALPVIRRLIRYDLRWIYFGIHRLTYFWYGFLKERILGPRRIVMEALAAWRYYR